MVRYLRNPNPLVTPRILRAFGATVGEKTTIKRSIYIDNTYEDQNSAGDFRYITIGSNCYIGDCVYFDLANQIILGNNVIISGKVSIITHADCNRSTYLAEEFPRICQPVVIEDGAWIGFAATILSGVTIGKQSVVAASSLVRDNIESRKLFAGIPARELNSLDQ